MLGAAGKIFGFQAFLYKRNCWNEMEIGKRSCVDLCSKYSIFVHACAKGQFLRGQLLELDAHGDNLSKLSPPEGTIIHYDVHVLQWGPGKLVLTQKSFCQKYPKYRFFRDISVLHSGN